MKGKLIIQFSLLVFIMGISDLKAQMYFSDQYPMVWQRNMNYSQLVAEAMPAELYDYKPSPESMSFKDQLLHIVDNISYLTSKINGQKKSFYNKENKDSIDKKETIELLSQANNYVLELIKNAEKIILDEKIVFGNENMTKENIFYLLRGHQVHHRAQCLVYLRLKDIAAPPYVGW
ncbi:DinB family protein [Cyclobacterium sp. 1_MG-2023]|uniref:DinB family protein n=1 Tax=Cyclobacterium sp. 1_MG-2023 TaxID=3062681 RepID=UPI0026E2E728|nr:DinB family protein [Cyclobacterium sp. 1_MG-2023]MDO6437941.1 DinB family protein [Cyclobacterium sp. 1_MG-2023]